MTSEEMKACLERLIANIDEAEQQIGSRRTNGDSADSIAQWYELLGESQTALLEFWTAHRKKIGFVVWDQPGDIPESVIAI